VARTTRRSTSTSLDRRFDEPRAAERRPDRLRAMAQLQRAGAGLEQERGEDEGMVAAHQGDLDVRAPLAEPLEMPRRRHAAEPAAEYQDAVHGSSGE
jgi:hypothetical protein